MFHGYWADFLTDQFLKKSKFSRAKMKKKNFRFEKKIFASQCTYSDSSRQAELKYIHPDQRKYFFHSVKVVIKTCHYHKQVKYEARTCVACIFLVMAMNFSMLLKNSHASPGDGSGIFGLSIISGLRTCVTLRTCSNI